MDADLIRAAPPDPRHPRSILYSDGWLAHPLLSPLIAPLSGLIVFGLVSWLGWGSTPRPHLFLILSSILHFRQRRTAALPHLPPWHADSFT